MDIKKLVTKVFRGKGADNAKRNHKRTTDEHEVKILQQKMEMLNGLDRQK